MSRKILSMIVLQSLALWGCNFTQMSDRSGEGSSLESSSKKPNLATPTATPILTATPTATPKSSPTATPKPSATATPNPTSTPASSATPSPTPQGLVYYFSSTGSDNNAGTSATAPFKSLTQFNKIAATLNPGDRVLFKRGDEFSGPMKLARSGTALKPILIGAYGTASASPVITGFQSVTAWANLGNNIWESTAAVSTLPTLNMVTINGQNTPMGRYPNTGYLSYETWTPTSVTDTALTATPNNWADAEVVLRVNHYTIDRRVITTHLGGTLSFTTPSTYDMINGFGYFIQADPRTLDLQNEWYYNPTSHKLRIYSTSVPTQVKVATIEDLVTLSTVSYVDVDGLALTGANNKALEIVSGSHINIRNCWINFTGVTAISSYPVPASYLSIENSIVDHSNNAGINASVGSHAVISNNVVTNTGEFAGMANPKNGSFTAIAATGDYGSIAYNTVDGAGYVGIRADGDATAVEHNIVRNFGFQKQDGGGIYVAPRNATVRDYAQRSVKYNTITNGIGAPAGTTSTTYLPAEGIYIDVHTGNVDIAYNTIANLPHWGIFLHNSHDVNVDHNTVYNVSFYQLYVIRDSTTYPIENISVTNNILVAKTLTQRTAYYGPKDLAMPASFKASGNIYARPLDDTKTIGTNMGGTLYDTLAEWKSFSGQDSGSTKSPANVTTESDIAFVYNDTGSSQVVPLTNNYIDMKKVSYTGSLTLKPYSSLVLIKAP